MLTIDEIIALLEASPIRITELTSSLPPDQIRSLADGDWSLDDVLAHLRACADVWGGCMLSILDGERTWRAVNPRMWIEKTDYRRLEFARSLRSYTRQRKELLDVLRRAPRAEWKRSLVVTGAGAPLKRDSLYFGERLARHERAHVKQIANMVERTAR